MADLTAEQREIYKGVETEYFDERFRDKLEWVSATFTDDHDGTGYVLGSFIGLTLGPRHLMETVFEHGVDPGAWVVFHTFPIPPNFDPERHVHRLIGPEELVELGWIRPVDLLPGSTLFPE